MQYTFFLGPESNARYYLYKDPSRSLPVGRSTARFKIVPEIECTRPGFELGTYVKDVVGSIVDRTYAGSSSEEIFEKVGVSVHDSKYLS